MKIDNVSLSGLILFPILRKGHPSPLSYYFWKINNHPSISTDFLCLFYGQRMWSNWAMCCGKKDQENGLFSLTNQLCLCLLRRWLLIVMCLVHEPRPKTLSGGNKNCSWWNSLAGLGPLLQRKSANAWTSYPFVIGQRKKETFHRDKLPVEHRRNLKAKIPVLT